MSGGNSEVNLGVNCLFRGLVEISARATVAGGKKPLVYLGVFTPPRRVGGNLPGGKEKRQITPRAFCSNNRQAVMDSAEQEITSDAPRTGRQAVAL